jgi:hypothetical protein
MNEVFFLFIAGLLDLFLLKVLDYLAGFIKLFLFVLIYAPYDESRQEIYSDTQYHFENIH